MHSHLAPASGKNGLCLPEMEWQETWRPGSAIPHGDTESHQIALHTPKLGWGWARLTVAQQSVPTSESHLAGLKCEPEQSEVWGLQCH